jgi:hypothetical protein
VYGGGFRVCAQEGASRNDADVNFLQQSFRFAEITLGLPLRVGCGMIASTMKNAAQQRCGMV